MHYTRKLASYRIGIIGLGYVGGAIQRYFERKGQNQLFIFDKYKKIGSPEEVSKADIIFAAVPTPYNRKGGFDLSYVVDAIKGIKGRGKVIVIKSTVLPGTTAMLQKKFPQHILLMNPEFLTQNTADQDFQFPDRQLVGYTAHPDSYPMAGVVMRLLPLAPFERILPATEAEMAKYFGNTWFSIKVVFANMMWELCQKLGIDYDNVKECAAADKRIGPSHLEVLHKGYRGYGGACLPKDIRALIQFAGKVGVDLVLHKAAEGYNRALLKAQGLKEKDTLR